MDLDIHGLPIIPAVEDLNLESKKSLIRTFLTKHYSKLHVSVILPSNKAAKFSSGFCCQRPKASVPWSAVRDSQDDFIESHFLPADQKIKDPSKLQSADADHLLDFWYQRQKNKIQPTFSFKAWQNHEREMKEPVEIMDWSGEDSNTGGDIQVNRPTAKPIRKPTGKATRKPTTKPTGKGTRKQTARIEHSSSEDEYEQDEDEDDEDDEDDDHNKSDTDEDQDAEAAPAAEEVPSPPKPKPHRKRARVSPVESEPEDHPPIKKSKTMVLHPQPVDKPAISSAKSSHQTGKSPRRSFGPTSGIQTRARQQTQVISEAAPPATSSGVKATAGKEKRVIKPSLKNSVNKYTYR